MKRIHDRMSGGSLGVVASFAVSVAATYFAAVVTLEDWFNAPSAVYIFFLIITFIVAIFYTMRMLRFFILKARLDKQTSYKSSSFGGRWSKGGSYTERPYEYQGLKWEVVFDVVGEEVRHVSKPFCPKNECETELNVSQTYWGNYLYVCPKCSFTAKKRLNSNTFRSNLTKIANAEVKKLMRQSREDS